MYALKAEILVTLDTLGLQGTLVKQNDHALVFTFANIKNVQTLLIVNPKSPLKPFRLLVGGLDVTHNANFDRHSHEGLSAALSAFVGEHFDKIQHLENKIKKINKGIPVCYADKHLALCFDGVIAEMSFASTHNSDEDTIFRLGLNDDNQFVFDVLNLRMPNVEAFDDLMIKLPDCQRLKPRFVAATPTSSNSRFDIMVSFSFVAGGELQELPAHVLTNHFFFNLLKDNYNHEPHLVAPLSRSLGVCTDVKNAIAMNDSYDVDSSVFANAWRHESYLF